MKKEKKNYMNLFAVGCALIAQQAVFAQQDTATIAKQKLNEVVVAATRTEKNVLDIGRSVTVISSEEIHNSIYNSVAELLSQQEGIYIVGTGQNPGMNQSIFMRGANNNQTMVMIDGVRITDPSSVDDAIDLSELSLSNVDHIEIVRGSQSTLFGSSAIGGVINIITKKNFSKGFHADVSEDAGTFGNKTSTFRENAFLNYTFANGFYVSGSVNKWDVQGLNATVDTLTKPLPYQKNPDRDNYTKTTMTGLIGFKNARWDVSASYTYLVSGAGVDGGAYTDAKNDTLIFTRNSYNYHVNYKASDHFKIQFTGGISDLQRKNVEDTNIVDAYNDKYYSSEIYKGTSITNELQLQYDLKGVSLIAGGGMYSETMTQSGHYYFFGSVSANNLDTLNPHQNIVNGFAQADINGTIINENLKAFNLIIGGRYSKQNTFGNNFSYEINPSYKLNPNTLLYLSYSTGFNAPALYQLYAPKSFGSSVTLGNINLQAETSQSFEIGIKHDFGNHTRFTASWFNTVVQHSIDYVFLWDGKKAFDSLSSANYIGDTYLNVGTQTNTGFEFSITSELSKKIFFSANMSIVNGTLTYNPSSIDTVHTKGNYVQLLNGGEFITKKVETNGLLRRPENNINISISYVPIEKLIFRMDARMVGGRTDVIYENNLGIANFGANGTTNVAAYTLVDFNAKYNFCKHFSAGFRMENIFNTPYSEINGYTTRGRGEYINLKYNF